MFLFLHTFIFVQLNPGHIDSWNFVHYDPKYEQKL